MWDANPISNVSTSLHDTDEYGNSRDSVYRGAEKKHSASDETEVVDKVFPQLMVGWKPSPLIVILAGVLFVTAGITLTLTLVRFSKEVGEIVRAMNAYLVWNNPGCYTMFNTCTGGFCERNIFTFPAKAATT